MKPASRSNSAGDEIKEPFEELLPKQLHRTGKAKADEAKKLASFIWFSPGF